MVVRVSSTSTPLFHMLKSRLGFAHGPASRPKSQDGIPLEISVQRTEKLSSNRLKLVRGLQTSDSRWQNHSLRTFRLLLLDRLVQAT